MGPKRKITKNPNKKYGRPIKQPIIPQPIVQTANVKLVVKYQYDVYYNRKFVKTVVDHQAEDYGTIKYTNNAH